MATTKIEIETRLDGDMGPGEIYPGEPVMKIQVGRPTHPSLLESLLFLAVPILCPRKTLGSWHIETFGHPVGVLAISNSPFQGVLCQSKGVAFSLTVALHRQSQWEPMGQGLP